MKASLYILLSIFIFNASAFADDFYGSRLSHFKEKSYDFRLSKAAIERAPKWEKTADYPPLSPRKALQIALAQAKELRPEVTNWNTDDIKLEQIGSSTSNYPSTEKWIFLVTLQDYSGPIAGVPWQLKIPIYMDGSTIKPTISKNKGYR
jgi:hypothetical protein